MKKDEILARSRKENKDERDQYVDKTANENSFLAIICVVAILCVVLFLQTIFTESAFADYRVFMLALLIGLAGNSSTIYHYNRDRKRHLVSAILASIGGICCLAAIIITGMGWL